MLLAFMYFFFQVLFNIILCIVSSQLLTDPERRKHFDNFGVVVEEGSQFRKKRDYNQFQRFDPLEELFGSQSGGYKFHFQDRDINLFHKLRVTTR
jgi:DnaJ-class molecular chaperone